MSLPTRTRRDHESEAEFLERLHAKYQGPATMDRMLQRSVEQFGDKVALVDGQGTRLTYQAMWQTIQKLAGGLYGLGLEAGERVAVMMRSHARYVMSYYAVITSHLVLVPLNVRLAPPELAYILSNAGVQAILADREFQPVIEAALRSLNRELPRIWTEAGEGLAWDGLLLEPKAPPTIEESSLAAIYYTSGTTGQPKGAMITHLNMVAVGQQNVEAWYFDSPDVVELEISPLFHVSFQEFGPPVHAVGGTLVVDNFSPARSLDLIEQERINSFFAVPSMLFLMLAELEKKPRDVSSVRLVKYGGAPMPQEKIRDVQQIFSKALLVQGFGQTESTGMIAVTWPEDVAEVPLSTGRAISGCQIRIVDDEDRDLPPGQVGEVVAKGPQIMAGYWENPAATAETLRGGFLHTGDLGYLDEKERLYIVDRKKDLIIRGGQNIYSAEVEEALYTHPAVGEAAVVAQPDPIYGEVVAAFIRLKPGWTVTGEELGHHLADRIAVYKRPVTYRFVEDFPRTASGKIRKVELREQLRKAASV
ncbi:MAG: AMP-binding protein [Firmicutes bacterium]|nr:AMP-binding protein [Bacillota bacterium]